MEDEKKIIEKIINGNGTIFGGVLREMVGGNDVGKYLENGGDIDIIVNKDFDFSIFDKYELCYGYNELRTAVRKFKKSDMNRITGMFPFCHYKGNIGKINFDIVMICSSDFVHNCDFTCNALIMNKNGLGVRGQNTTLQKVKDDISKKIIRIMPLTKYSNLNKILCRLLIKLTEGYTVENSSNLIRVIKEGINYWNQKYRLDPKYHYYKTYINNLPYELYKLIAQHYDDIFDDKLGLYAKQYIGCLYMKYEPTKFIMQHEIYTLIHTNISAQEIIQYLKHYSLRFTHWCTWITYLLRIQPPKEHKEQNSEQELLSYLGGNKKYVDKFNRLKNEHKRKIIGTDSRIEFYKGLVEIGVELPVFVETFSRADPSVIQYLFKKKKINHDNLKQLTINADCSLGPNAFREFCDANKIKYQINCSNLFDNDSYKKENHELYNMYLYKTPNPTIDQINYTTTFESYRPEPHIKYYTYSPQHSMYSKYIDYMINKYGLAIFPRMLVYFLNYRNSYYYYHYFLTKLSPKLPQDVIRLIFKLL
jgi:hypothetical protein